MKPEDLIALLGREPLATRKFCVSVSGGVDSMSLLAMMAKLQKQQNFCLSAFHVNFQLRGRASLMDEKFVQKFCERKKIPLTIVRTKIPPIQGIQEAARKERLKALHQISREWEILEAHHADDQIETFFLRLFRGAGLKGLTGMKASSLREGRRILRPFLTFSRADIQKWAQKNRISFRQDQSNLKDVYDRNFIRRRLLPRIDERFSSGRTSVLRTMQLLGEWEEFFSKSQEALLGFCPQSQSWNWAELQKVPRVLLQEVLCRWFSQNQHVMLSHRKAQELAEKIRAGKSFSFNAPKSCWVRARRGRLEFIDPTLSVCKPGVQLENAKKASK